MDDRIPTSADEFKVIDSRTLAEWLKIGPVRDFNAYRNRFPHQYIDLSGQIFTCRWLRGVNLRHVNLREAIFFGCDLRGAAFNGAPAIDVRFKECAITDAVFDGCDLRGARFFDCALKTAYTRGARNLPWRYRLPLLLSARRWSRASTP